VPGEDDAFLINPYGLHFSEVCASNLVKINSAGETLDGSLYPVNKAGFTQHSMFHKELPDMHCIIHTHTTATMAVCAVEGGLQPTNFYACNFIGQIGYHDFEGVTVRSEEGPRLVESLNGKRVLMLKIMGQW
jgi:ribulose-5-phosphate 4-epimerase/fuculose-1-phosphate aldolase